jgi:hypothetical protein
MTGERMPIGGQEGPARILAGGPKIFCSFLPQQAWLEGSILTVESGQDIRRCDLASASRIAIRSVPRFTSWSFLALYAYQAPGSPPVRLVLEGPRWVLLTAAQLRALAAVISSRSGELGGKTRRVVRRLGELAAYVDLRTKPIDWSFRTDPRGQRQPGGKQPPG